MSSRNNFFDADNSLMERNLRFVQNDFDNNFYRHFGGSRGDDGHCATPPRDYKIVRSEPAHSSNHDFHIEERKEFLRQMGLARHEAYELAVSTEFDVKHYQKMRHEMLKYGERTELINDRILNDIKRLPCDNYNLDYQMERESGFHNSIRNSDPPPPPRMLNWDSDGDARDAPVDLVDVYEIPQEEEEPTTSKNFNINDEMSQEEEEPTTSNNFNINDEMPQEEEEPTTSKNVKKLEAAKGKEKLSHSVRRKRSYFRRLGFEEEEVEQLTFEGYTRRAAKKLSKELNITPFRIAVLACDYPQTLLFTEHMNQIQSTLMTKMSSEVDIQSTLPITNIVYKAGFMSIDCKNDEAMVKWLLLNVRLIHVGENIELMAIEERTLPDPFICVGVFPNSSELDTKDILHILQKQNSSLVVKAWRTLKTVINGRETKLILALDPRSAEAVMRKKCFVVFKSERIKLKQQKMLKPYLRSDPSKPQKIMKSRKIARSRQALKRKL